MTRMIVAREEEPFPDGRIISKGALYCDEELVPVVLIEGLDDIVGAARAIERKAGDGSTEVSMDVTLFDFVTTTMRVDLESRDPTVFIAPFDAVEEDGLVRVTKGRIREVVLTPRLEPLPGQKAPINGTKRL